MNICEVVEVRNLADAVGFACSNSANERCSDCDMEICDAHADHVASATLGSALLVCRSTDIRSLRRLISVQLENGRAPKRESWQQSALCAAPTGCRSVASWKLIHESHPRVDVTRSRKLTGSQLCQMFSICRQASRL